MRDPAPSVVVVQTPPARPRTQGAWDYRGGVSGTPTIPAGWRVLQITAVALGSAGSVQINGGDVVPLPYDATDKASTSLTIKPDGNLVAPTIVFTNTDSYFVEIVK